MNAEEFKSAFLPLGPMLYRIAYRMLGAEEDARDAVQELYVKLCREGDRALRSANPQGYCVRMMQNVCADILRRGGRRSRRRMPRSRVGRRRQWCGRPWPHCPGNFVRWWY